MSALDRHTYCTSVVGVARAQLVLSGRGSSRATPGAAAVLTTSAFSWNQSVSVTDDDITRPAMPAVQAYYRHLPATL